MDYTQSSLAPRERFHLNLFNLLLEHHGWEDPQHIEWRLDHGQAVPVLGMRRLTCAHGYVEARFHAGIDMISLDIAGPECFHRLHCAYGDAPQHLLEWLVRHAGSLFEAPQAHIPRLAHTCLHILQENADHHLSKLPSPSRS